jgi:hypothetical protein
MPPKKRNAHLPRELHRRRRNTLFNYATEVHEETGADIFVFMRGREKTSVFTTSEDPQWLQQQFMTAVLAQYPRYHPDANVNRGNLFNAGSH